MAFQELSRSDSLIDRVQRLPPELYSEINHLTFTMNIRRRRIDSSHKPPGVLQGNQKWRNALLPTFYGKTIFITTDSEAHLDYLTRWLTSLTTEQRNHVVCNGIWVYSQRKLQSKDPGISASGVLRQDRLVLQNRRALLNLRESVFWAIWKVAASVEEHSAILNSLTFRVFTDSGREIWWDEAVFWSRDEPGLVSD